MEIVKIIRNGHISELNAAVFGQRLDNSSTSTFTRPFNNDEEIELIQRMLSDDTPENWVTFMREYRKHYPLCNQTINLLIDKAPQDKIAMKTLTEELSRYGYTEEQAIKICNKVLASGVAQYRPLLKVICTCGRTFHRDVFSLLIKIEGRDQDTDEKVEFSDIYQKAIRHYREANNLDRFYEQKAPTEG